MAMTVDQIFEALGGYINLAEKTGIPLTTVHSWKRVGFVPEWRRPALIALAKKSKVVLTDADFPAPRRRTRSKAAAA